MQNPSSLPDLLDVQGLEDARGVDLHKVGIRNIELPIRVLQKDGKTQPVQATATMGVGLLGQYKGTHMSRFVIQLSEWGRDKILTLNLREFLEEARTRLEAPSSYLELRFRYFMDKKAPVSGQSAPMAYECMFRGSLTDRGVYHLILGVTIPICTLCPCSKAISDYGAHNQRADLRAQVVIEENQDQERPVVWIEDLVQTLEQAASCPVYPLVKRPDEKWMTEQAYDNPKFVEDVIRDATLKLRNYKGVSGFALEVEALESIHAHNAWASHHEGFPVQDLSVMF